MNPKRTPMVPGSLISYVLHRASASLCKGDNRVLCDSRTSFLRGEAPHSKIFPGKVRSYTDSLHKGVDGAPLSRKCFSYTRHTGPKLVLLGGF